MKKRKVYERYYDTYLRRWTDERYATAGAWRGFVAGSYRDFETQEEAFKWAEKKVIDFRLRHPNYAHYWGTK